MQWFFFHIRLVGALILDPEGSELPDLSTAKTEALADLRYLAAERLRRGEPVDVQLIEITDGTGRILATVGLEDAMQSLQ